MHVLMCPFPRPPFPPSFEQQIDRATTARYPPHRRSKADTTIENIMDTTGINAPKGDVDVEEGTSHQSTGRESPPPGLPPALPKACMERPYNATTEEVLAYYQVKKGGERGRRGGKRRGSRGWSGDGVDACENMHGVLMLPCPFLSSPSLPP